MWGTHIRTSLSNHGERFIPTGVGNTRPKSSITILTIGSSPRVWGTRERFNRDVGYARFIPTGVGNTVGCGRRFSSASVHPHGCGEHTIDPFSAEVDLGSSPRVWGTPQYSNNIINQKRFIPTGVGNTRSGGYIRYCTAVHPHGCGEHHPYQFTMLSIMRFIPTGVGNTPRPDCPVPTSHGSSPRVWGTPISSAVSSSIFRFIPTGVGNTDHNHRPGTAKTVHPHGCGEHGRPSRENVCKTGSSPRVWGTRQSALQPPERCPVHPHGCGEHQWKHRNDLRGHPVHPHGCGEHAVIGNLATIVNGSSPRVWGTQDGEKF